MVIKRKVQGLLFFILCIDNLHAQSEKQAIKLLFIRYLLKVYHNQLQIILLLKKSNLKRNHRVGQVGQKCQQRNSNKDQYPQIQIPITITNTKQINNK